jgi:hypothetical protein
MVSIEVKKIRSRAVSVLLVHWYQENGVFANFFGLHFPYSALDPISFLADFIKILRPE